MIELACYFEPSELAAQFADSVSSQNAATFIDRLFHRMPAEDFELMMTELAPCMRTKLCIQTLYARFFAADYHSNHESKYLDLEQEIDTLKAKLAYIHGFTTTTKET